MQNFRLVFLCQVGEGLLATFEGQAANLVKAANESAATLVTLVTRHFPGQSVVNLLRYAPHSPIVFSMSKVKCDVPASHSACTIFRHVIKCRAISDGKGVLVSVSRASAEETTPFQVQ
jgi:hypothetical protein